ncbi:MAG: TetR/AcrR family transcriptional regulator [Pseudomonadota bacterium]|nr:TetR/AcrR family transcriptional regulator [Pseudomonadota bacterium]
MPKILSDQDIAGFRERLCDAAERLFAEHGTEAVTIRQLAAAIGVSPMTPYRYFKDRDAILAAVRARGFDRHAQALERAYDENPGDPVERANAIGAAYVRFALENPEAYTLMFDTRQASEADYPDLVRAGSRSRATMTRHLRDLVATGSLKGDPDLIGHLYWAALHGPLMLQLSGMLPAAYDARTLIDALTAAVGKAVIGADPAARSKPIR